MIDNSTARTSNAVQVNATSTMTENMNPGYRHIRKKADRIERSHR